MIFDRVKKMRSAFRPLIFASVAASLLGAGQAWAQQELDDITKQVLRDAFIQLRFTALSLETDDEAGQALEGLVRAMLARGEINEALEELDRINDDVWNARALISVSNHFRREGEEDLARKYLRRAVDTIIDDPRDRSKADILRTIAVKEAELGDFDQAIEVARALPAVAERVAALQAAAEASFTRGDGDAQSEAAAAAVLLETFEQAKTIQTTNQRVARLLISIGRSQIQANDVANAQQTFDYTLEWILRGQKRGQNTALAQLAIALTENNEHRKAMGIVRRLTDGPEQALALSSIARALGERGELDAAVPIFTLAYEGIQRIENDQTRAALYAHLVREQTRVGRLADAFSTAGSIPDRIQQAASLLGMADILIRKGKFDEAQVLKEYIPYIGMRSQIFAATAMREGTDGNNRLTSEILIEGLQSTGFPLLSKYLPKAIRDTLTIQVNFGDSDSDLAIFERTEELAHEIADPLERVNALTFLAVAKAQRGYIEDAKNTITSAWRLGWTNKHLQGYDRVLANIVEGLIAVGDPLSAFDSAARIPDPPDNLREERAPDGSFRAPKYFALTNVAAASARDREMDIAIRAARQIKTPSARAAALAAVAVAMASPDLELREIIGEGPGWEENGIKILLSDDFKAQAYNIVQLEANEFRAGFAEADQILGGGGASASPF